MLSFFSFCPTKIISVNSNWRSLIYTSMSSWIALRLELSTWCRILPVSQLAPDWSISDAISPSPLSPPSLSLPLSPLSPSLSPSLHSSLPLYKHMHASVWLRLTDLCLPSWKANVNVRVVSKTAMASRFLVAVFSLCDPTRLYLLWNQYPAAMK